MRSSHLMLLSWSEQSIEEEVAAGVHGSSDNGVSSAIAQTNHQQAAKSCSI